MAKKKILEGVLPVSHFPACPCVSLRVDVLSRVCFRAQPILPLLPLHSLMSLACLINSK